MVTCVAPIWNVCRGIIEVPPPVACLLMRRAGVHRPAEDLLDAAGKRWRQTPRSRVALGDDVMGARCMLGRNCRVGRGEAGEIVRKRRPKAETKSVGENGCASAGVVACGGSMPAPVGVGEVATSTVSPVPPEAAAPADDAVGAEVEMVASSAARAAQESDAMTTAKRGARVRKLNRRSCRRISAIAGACSNAMHPRRSGPSASFIDNACRVTTRRMPGHKLHR